MTTTARNKKRESPTSDALIQNLVAHWASLTPERPALRSPVRPDHPALLSLTFAQLHTVVHATIQALQNLGLRRGACVAAVLPNGPEAVVAFLAASALGAYAPLNPAYRAQEFEFFLSDLQPDALLLAAGDNTPARGVAKSLSIPIVELALETNGAVTVRGDASPNDCDAPDRRLAQESADALLLYTSGTTARPKLVPLTHANIRAAVRANRAALELTPADRCLNVMPLFHIHGLVAATLTALSAGSSVVCCPEFNPNQFADWLREFQPTWYSAPATIHRDVLNRWPRNNPPQVPLRFIRVGSTSIAPALIQQLEDTFHAPVIEAYGMTEAGPLIASNPLPPGLRKCGSVGLPTGTDVVILDEHHRPCAADVAGEIAIRGPNVTRGYRNNPATNADAFVDGWFRTGDLGHLDADGYLFITGRKKEQINRAGEKISPYEVETVLLRHPAVSEAVVFAAPEPRLGEEVAAAVVLNPGASVTERRLREHCAQSLADFKVPRRVMLLPELPRAARSATGKLQRAKLAEILQLRFDSADFLEASAFAAPESPTEQTLAKLWCEILGLEHAGRDDNFLALGGNSILGARLLARVRSTLQVEISILALFAEAATLRGMAQLIDAQSAHTEEHAPDTAPAAPQATHAQERLWFIDRLQPGTALYNLKRILRLKGALDLRALQQALTFVLRRHEALRTVFDDHAGRPVPRLLPPKDFALKSIDLRHTAETEREALALRLAGEECGRPFDLSRDVLLRGAFYQLADDEHLLALTLHHIAGDAWSWTILLQDLAEQYVALRHGDALCATEFLTNFNTLAAQERARSRSAAAEADLAYWRTKLADLPETLALPRDFTAPDPTAIHGQTHVFSLNSETTAKLKNFSRQHNATVFMTLLAAFKALLFRYSGQEDFAIGVPAAGRSTTASEALIGLFVNTLVLRDDLSGDPSFAAVLERVRNTTVEALAHQQTPFDTLVSTLAPSRQLGRNPLFQVMFDLRNVAAPPRRLGDVNVTPLWLDSGTALFDLTLTFVETDAGLDGYLEFKTSLFKPETIDRLIQHLRILLDGALSNPSQPISALPLLPPFEQQELLSASGTRTISIQRVCVHSLIHEQAAQFPERTAVICEGQSLTYRELDAKANQLARYLRLYGARPQSCVAVCLERSAEMIVGILAILKAGGAYVPLDPQAPLDRLRFILEETDASVVLTHTAFRSQFKAARTPIIYIDAEEAAIERQIAAPFHADVNFDHDAYVLYTSGSTGQPKGVVVTHGNLANAYWAWEAEYQLRGNINSVLQAASYTFDVFSGDFVRALCSGSTLVLCPRETLLMPELLYDLLREQAIECFETVPAVLRTLAAWMEAKSLKLPALKLLIAGSDALYASEYLRLRHLFAPARVLNTYGVTEATIDSTFFDDDVPTIDRDTVTPIGRPFPNTRVYILNSALQLQPRGVAGELCIGGAGVSRGYLNRPELNARHFIPDPFTPGGRLYRTGDLARLRPDGQIEFIGRRDTQVKIRGFRVELGEIESVLRAHPNVREAAVIAKDSPTSGKHLLAFVVPGAVPADIPDVRAFLKARLPEHMLPAHISTLETLPLSANGKIDRKQLASLSVVPAETARKVVAPSNSIETQILAIWQRTLGLSTLSVTDNFFEVGGHSLLAATLIHELRNTFHCDVSLRALFEAPTIAGLAKRIATLRDAAPESSAPPACAPLEVDPSARHEPFPLTDVQEAYWIGRSASFELGNVACHSYKEIDVDELDLPRLERALQTVLARHDMLRAIIRSDGRQRILPELARIWIPVADIRNVPDVDQPARLQAIREQNTGAMLNLAEAPLLRLSATRLTDRRTRLHFCIDGLISDALSDRIFIHELHALYHDPHAALPPLEGSFRDCVLHEQSAENAPRVEQSRAYWLSKIPDLPPAPELPLAKDPAAIAKPKFVRRTTRLNADTWRTFKMACAQHSVTPSTGLLLAYAQVLKTWSARPQFTLNLTIYNRAPVHPDIDKIIGNFTSLTMLGLDLAPRLSVAEHARRLQEQLWADLDHRHFSGIQVLRELAHTHGRNSGALMPIVFTSVLDMSRQPHANATWKLFGEVVWAQNETPQVWLDCQVIDDQGELVINWDVVAELFPDGLLDDMFAAYQALITRLAHTTRLWQETALDLLPEHQAAQFARVNATGGALPPGLLHEPFAAQVAQRPDAIALLAPVLTLTYAQLERHARQLASELQRSGVASRELVAVVMEKHWAQVVAVLGILEAGAAYLPIDATLPQDRLHYMLADGDVRHVVTTPELARELTWPAGIHCHLLSSAEPVVGPVAPVPRTPDELAYVIYTSGSTGKPKGVMIDHRGALNTIAEINQRFGIGADDRVLALSALSFDLSVYDIFGLLAAGGAVVIPEARKFREPSHWVELLRAHGVTVWNSVPAFLEMFANYCADTNQRPFETLRVILLSGDWIPVGLPEKIRRFAPHARLISLGGATEASIWSIYYPIERVDPEWKSIPYGKPLKNQKFYVLNEQLEPCPTWVTGHLYIGGIGLAQGYWKNPEKTNASFIRHPVTGERLYRTGDLGRFRADGNIEFLGRSDHQVKLRGFRIELGEIEAALAQHPAVRDAVVSVHDDGDGKRRLVGYVTLRGDAAPSNSELAAHLQRSLPEYMVPHAFMVLDTLPLSANGKVDRRSLPPPAQPQSEDQSGFVAPRSPTESFVAAIWQRVLKLDSIGIHANFFDLGGDSIHAIQVISDIQKEYHIDLNLFSLFETPTVAGLSDLITQKQVEMTDQVELAQILGDIEALTTERTTMSADHHLDLEALSDESAQRSNFETDS